MVTNSVVPIAKPPRARATTRDDHPQGARRGVRSVGRAKAWLTHSRCQEPRRPAHSPHATRSAQTWDASQPQQVGGGRRPARGARRQPLEAGLPHDDVVPGLRQLRVAQQELRTTAAQDRLPEQRRHPLAGDGHAGRAASRAAPRRGSAPAPSRPRRGPAAGAPGRGRCRPARAAGRAGSPTRSAPTRRRSRESSARTVTAAASPGWHSAASCAVVRPSPATRGLGEQQEQLGVPQRQLDRARTAGVSRARSRPRTSSRGALRGGGGTRRAGPRCSLLAALPAQLRLDRGDRGPHQREHVRARDVVAAGDVDRAEQHPGHRVVHRRRRAAPRLDRTAEVLAAVDLDGVVDGERGAGGVGADDVLGPAGTLDEVHAGRLAAQPVSPSTHSIRPPASVTATIIWSSSASSTSSRRITGMTVASGMGLAVGEQVVVQQLDRRRAAVGIDAAAQGPPPRLADDVAHRVVGQVACR